MRSASSDPLFRRDNYVAITAMDNDVVMTSVFDTEHCVHYKLEILITLVDLLYALVNLQCFPALKFLRSRRKSKIFFYL